MKQPMKLIIRVLAVAAVIQLGLIGIAYMGGDELQASQSSVALLNFKPDAVDNITVYGPDKQVAKLHHSDGWKTESGFPADSEKIDQLLHKLAGLKHGLPVATSPSAWSRFKLGKDDFERHLVLSQAGKVVAELYLGKGAGARQSYVRSGHDQAAYSVALGSYELPLEASQWQDKALLQIAADQVTGLEIDGVKLTRAAEADQKKTDQKKANWNADSLPAGKVLDQHAVRQALHLLATLRFEKVLDKQPPAGFDLAHPVLSVAVHRQKKLRQYRFAKAEKGDKYLLKVSDRPEYFAVSSYTLNEWKKQMKRDALFVDAPSEKPASTMDKNKATIPAGIAAPADKKPPFRP